MRPAEKISKLLQERGWSQSQLARASGLRQRQVAYVVSGERQPKVSAALALADALNVDARWLWADDSRWPPPAPDALELRDLPDAIVMAEVFRRKRVARDALEKIVAQYEAARNALRQAQLSRNRDELDTRADAFLTQWRDLMYGGEAESKLIDPWIDYERQWRDLWLASAFEDSPLRAEMKSVFSILLEARDADADRHKELFGQVLKIWFEADRDSRDQTPVEGHPADPSLASSRPKSAGNTQRDRATQRVEFTQRARARRAGTTDASTARAGGSAPKRARGKRPRTSKKR